MEASEHRVGYAGIQLQAEGLTGHLPQLDRDASAASAWFGGSDGRRSAGEYFERAPYYLRGLASLAWALGDQHLEDQAMSWINRILDSGNEDGYFGPACAKGEWGWWPHMVALDLMREYYSYTSDARVINLMSRYFEYQLKHLSKHPLQTWAVARGGENLDIVVLALPSHRRH